VVFNNLNMMFIEFVKSEAMSLDALQAAVARQIAPLAGLLTPVVLAPVVLAGT
jgi:hypothetical protein